MGKINITDSTKKLSEAKSKASAEKAAEQSVKKLDKIAKSLDQIQSELVLAREKRQTKKTSSAVKNEKVSSLEKAKDSFAVAKPKTESRSKTSQNTETVLTKNPDAHVMTDLFLGGALGINPALLKTFGLDKGIIGKAKSAGTFITDKLFGGNKKDETTEQGTTKSKKTSSAVENTKDDRLVSALSGLFEKYFGKKEKKKEEKEKNKESFDWLGALVAGGVLLSLVTDVFDNIGITDLVKKTQKIINGGASFLLQTLLGINAETADSISSWAMPAIEGAVLGYKFGKSMQAAALGAVIGFTITSIQKAKEDFNTRLNEAKSGKYTPPASVGPFGITTFTGMVAGAAIGYKFAGFTGLIAGAILGFLGGGIMQLIQNDEVRDALGKKTIEDKGDQEILGKMKAREKELLERLDKNPKDKEARKELEALQKKRENMDHQAGLIESDIQSFGNKILDDNGNLNLEKAKLAGVSNMTERFLLHMQQAGIKVTPRTYPLWVTRYTDLLDGHYGFFSSNNLSDKEIKILQDMQKKYAESDKKLIEDEIKSGKTFDNLTDDAKAADNALKGTTAKSKPVTIDNSSGKQVDKNNAELTKTNTNNAEQDKANKEETLRTQKETNELLKENIKATKNSKATVSVANKNNIGKPNGSTK